MGWIRARALRPVTWVSVSIGLAACSPFEGYEAAAPDAAIPLFESPEPEPDAGDGEACVLAGAPRRPRVASGGGEIEILAAIRTVDTGDTDDDNGVPKYLSIGFDLDGACTGQGDATTCRSPSWAIPLLDGLGGRDNSLPSLFYQANRFGGGSYTRLADDLTETGFITGMLRVRGYNGASSDNQVELAWYGVTRLLLPGEDLSPRWDGSDVWQALDLWLDAEYEVPDGGGIEDDVELTPKYVDSSAYVIDDVVVARLPLMAVNGGMLSNVIITAKIVPYGGAFALREGMIGGRIAIDDTLHRLELVFDDVTREPYCTDAPGYLARKQRLCAHADVSFSGVDDGSEECDAASFQWRFDALPAQMRGVADSALTELHTCEPELRPSNDTCKNLTEIFGVPDLQW